MSEGVKEVRVALCAVEGKSSPNGAARAKGSELGVPGMFWNSQEAREA